MTEGEGKGNGRFWRRRECWVPTWRTCAGALVGIGVLVAVIFLRAQPFLAPVDKVDSRVLVVEGWCDDFVMEEALREFGRGGYTNLFVTGGPVEKGAVLSEFGNYADIGAKTLRKMAKSPLPILAVPAPRVDRDRTYSTAVALRRWFDGHGGAPPRINLVTVGAHARRSRLLFEKALRPDTEVGILAVEDPYYDPKRWWVTSYGVRTVTSELIAYLYSSLLFHPSPISRNAGEIVPDGSKQP
ncbi:MAG: ElyC/SanA/YdcF family protein [Verrucomicrobiota bacterium]